MRAKKVFEDIGSPMVTTGNVPGMGNAIPPSATTNNTGSGDKWNNTLGPYQQKEPKKKKIFKRKKKTNEQFYPSLKEDNISPYDKLGTAMAKKMGVQMVFKKGKGQTVKQKKFN
jgi:hypothetical protein